MDNEIVLREKTSKIYLMLFLLLISIIAVTIVLVFDFSQMNVRGILAIFTADIVGLYTLKAFFLVVLVVLIYMTYKFIKRLKNRKDIFIVNSEGITDHTTLISFGYVPWKDVEGIIVRSQSGQEFIEIILKNEEEYLKKPNLLIRLISKANKKLGHEIVCINLNLTGVKPLSVIGQMQEIFENYNLNN